MFPKLSQSENSSARATAQASLTRAHHYWIPLNYSLWLKVVLLCYYSRTQLQSHMHTTGHLFFCHFHSAIFNSIEMKILRMLAFIFWHFMLQFCMELRPYKVSGWKSSQMKRGTPIWNTKCAFGSAAYSYFDKLKVQAIIFHSFLVGLHFVALQ